MYNATVTDVDGSRSGRVTLVALAFAAGIAAGTARSTPPPEVWLACATISLSFTIVARRNAGRALVALTITVATLGAAWIGLRGDAVAPGDLLTRLGTTPSSIHVVGRALDAPSVRSSRAGSFGRFDFRAPYTEFPLEVEALIARDGAQRAARGTLLVRVGETVAPFRAGDRVVVRGTARRGKPIRNPGGFDHDRFLRARGYAGVMSVGERTLLTVIPEANAGMAARLTRLRAAFRMRAEEHLSDGLPPATARDAVLGALLFGRRDRDDVYVGAAFRRVGLAHFLAISGLHLGILVGLVLLIAGTRARARPWHAGLVAGSVLVYLLLIDVRLPVLRAAVMTTAGALARAGRRRWPGASLVALSGVGLLVWRPQQLFEPGFQLSFGVVLALVRYGSAVRARWFGVRGGGAITVMGLLRKWLGGAVATAVVAWAIATPITVYHFGMISPGAVPLSVAALPMVTALLVLGYMKILIGAILPSAGLVLGHALVPLTDGLVALVEIADTWPWSVVHVPGPSAAWAIVAIAWTVAWARGGITGRAKRCAWLGLGIALGTWLAWPALPFSRRPDLRIDTLAVGDGACHLLRSGGRAAMFDAGSSSNLDAGRTVIVPALRALGVREIEWIGISHANLDHFSAVPEVVAAYPEATIMISAQFLRAASKDPEGPAALLLSELARKGTSVTVVAAGATQPLGVARVRWLSPPSDRNAERENDNSLVLAVETMRHRVLFTGDIETKAIDRLRERYPALTADVVELPHHGSFNPAAAALVGQLDPVIILQSTGHRRLERDAWATRLTPRSRLVTARDGACRVEFDDDAPPGRTLRFGVHGNAWIAAGE